MWLARLQESTKITDYFQLSGMGLGIHFPDFQAIGFLASSTESIEDLIGLIVV